MKPKHTKPDYRSQLAIKARELQGQATYIREKPADQKPEPTAKELFNPGRFTGEGCGVFPAGKQGKGNAPEWVKEIYGQ